METEVPLVANRREKQQGARDSSKRVLEEARGGVSSVSTEPVSSAWEEGSHKKATLKCTHFKSWFIWQTFRFTEKLNRKYKDPLPPPPTHHSTLASGLLCY